MKRKEQLVGAVLIFYMLIGLVFLPNAQLLKAEPVEGLLINEVMYRPTENENTNEWIELYNPTTQSIDVAGWMIADEKETDILQGDNDHGDGTTVIPPGGYALITDKGTTVYETYLVSESAIRLYVDDSTLCGYGLNNQKEKLLLIDLAGEIIDAMEWGADYDDVPGAPAKLVAKGNSLARYQEQDTDDSSVDFIESSIPTPGSKNIHNEESTFIDAEETTPLILITELYYHAYPTKQNEFICITNPTNETVDISGWYITDDPWKDPSDRAKIFFPEQTFFPSNTSWYITQNATAFITEKAASPQFEYAVDSHPGVPQMKTYKQVSYSNTGGLVGLCTSRHTIIDLLIYGQTDEYVTCWDGPSIPSSGQGVILKRNKQNGTYIDTDTALDWMSPRIYRIGQSDLALQTYSSTAEIIVFISPDNSYETIVNELRAARFSIDINMYEFTSTFLYNEIIDALKRNVTVRLFMEGSPVGGITDKQQYILHSIADNGGQVRFIVSDTAKRVYARYPYTHAKYIIIDNETVIVESCNWGNTGVPQNPTYGNREWGVVIKNRDAATFYLQVFEDDWSPECSDSYSLEAMNFSVSSDFVISDYVPKGSYIPKFSLQKVIDSCMITPVFSPDTSEQAILDAINTATTSIYVQQLYIYKDWGDTLSPFVERLIEKAEAGLDIRVILNYNPSFSQTIIRTNETKEFLEDHGIAVKYLSTEWMPFAAVHNKGMVCDNRTVLISSINWNEQSVRKNREAGIMIENEEVATYYANVFLYDWSLDLQQPSKTDFSWADYKYLLLIAVVFSITIMLILRDWRKRKWR